MFDPVDPQQSLPDLELGILKYWREEDTFKRSLKHRENNEVFSFYDGPPFATGLPHYGHILAGTIKDVIPRYQTMRGKYVKRRFGWDCHGLPVENEIEKEKKLSSKKDIEALGIANFNALCRSAVQRYAKEWRTTVERLGRWVDMDHDYRTMDPDYMESIWWVFKQLYDRKLIYEGHKPMHVCPRCQTPLSNFEVTQGYKDIQDYSITAMFELQEETKSKKKSKTYFLAWTTTGWTLPGNMFLAVHPEVTYVHVESDGNTFIMAKDLVESVFKGKEFTVGEETTGKKLVGKKYVPLFPYYEEKYLEKAFRVVEGDFVTTTDGTGIVHIATGYGEDDFAVGQREKVGVVQHVDIDGTFKKEITDFAGKSAKPKDDHQSGDKMIAKWLKEKGKLFKAESFMHTYPHCWRCDSPLLNYATSSWFVAVEKVKDKMLAANAKTQWVPNHLRDGRFGKWLEGARDWAISRNRFWGTPLPIWRNTLTGDIEVIGSRDELMDKSGDRFTKVFVARHAESQGNVDRIYQGKEPGTDLTQRGAKMAEDLGQRVLGGSKMLKVKAIYCSPLQRTRQTAAAIAAATGAPLIVDDRLREVSFGEYEGKHIDFDDLAFVRERRAHKLEKGQIESVYHFQGMETWDSTQLRMGEFFEEILPKHKGEAIAVVTHADLVMNAMHFFTGEDPHKIVHQPYPELACLRTFFWDHETESQMDLHKETVDDLVWKNSSKHSVDLTLVRHGETDFNKERIVQGSNIDMVLNKVGKEQAKKTGQELKGQKFDVLVTSDLKRAKETAKIIAKELDMKIDAESELLRERNTGDWSGKSVDDIRTEYKIKAKFGIAFAKPTPPNGESFDQFIARARRAHDWLLKEYPGKKVLVVAHGGFLKAMLYLTKQKTYKEAAEYEPKNACTIELTIAPQMRRIEEVLDCWFESGSMPYAQEHFPFDSTNAAPGGFPADFIAEGLDQTRGWFYTLTVLSASLFDCPAFKHCVVNGTVLAEDGKKMSKRLKNYPEPTEIVKKYGADAVRFALMSSPAVRAEDLRFSEKFVSESVRSVLLPLWNAYRLFVTYANGANWKPSLDFALKNAKSPHMLDRWIVCKTQELVNRMTKELEGYDLSATCAELASSIDDLTNWYVRLSRRRLAGKEEGTADAFDTLYRVLVTNCQLLAPFCPFITEAIYLNLVGEDHDSIHFTEWPKTAELSKDDLTLVETMDATRTVVSLGLSLRNDAKTNVRQPLQSATISLPSHKKILPELIKEELNVKTVLELQNPGDIAVPSVQIDARKVGPRLGKKVQELIVAAKAGKFEYKDDKVIVLGETLEPDEAKLVYKGKEGKFVAFDKGIVVGIDTALTPELKLEGQARELVRAIQQQRKDAGLEFTDMIVLSLTGAEEILNAHREMILEETRATLGEVKGDSQVVDLGGVEVSVRLEKK